MRVHIKGGVPAFTEDNPGWLLLFVESSEQDPVLYGPDERAVRPVISGPKTEALIRKGQRLWCINEHWSGGIDLFILRVDDKPTYHFEVREIGMKRLVGLRVARVQTGVSLAKVAVTVCGAVISGFREGPLDVQVPDAATRFDREVPL